MKSIKFLLSIIIAAFVLFGTLGKDVKSQTSVTGTEAHPGNYACSVVEFTVKFETDSLLNAKTNLFTILPYADYLAAFSWKATGTTPNFRINAYMTNFNSSDTAYWTLINQWDTTGNYTAKPVNDTLRNALITACQGLPMRYLAFQVKGLAGNREDVILYCRATFLRKGT